MPYPGFFAPTRNCDDYAEQTARALQTIAPDVIVVSQRCTVFLENSRFDNGEGGVELGEVDPFVIDDLEAGSKDYQDALIAKVKTGLQSLLENSKVVLIGPSPEAGWHGPRHLQKMLIFGYTDPEELLLHTYYDRFLDRNRTVMAQLDELKLPNLYHFRPHQALCDTVIEDRCLNSWQGQVLYYDDDHLSNTGAMFVAPDLFDLLSDALKD